MFDKAKKQSRERYHGRLHPTYIILDNQEVIMEALQHILLSDVTRASFAISGRLATRRGYTQGTLGDMASHDYTG